MQDRTHKLLPLLPLFIGLCAPACIDEGPVDDDEMQDYAQAQQAIANGQSSTAYPAVAALYRNTGSAVSCTGTLIDTNVVLTAAHCTNISQVRFRNGGVFPVVQAVAYPTYATQDPDRGLRDVQLLRLGSSLNGLGQPAAMPLALNKPSPSDNAPLTLMGYGFAEDNGPPRFRTGINNQGYLLYDSQWFLPPEGGATLCPGDSGGPVVNAAGEVVAVHAGSTSATCGEGAGVATAITADSLGGDWLADVFPIGTANGQPYIWDGSSRECWVANDTLTCIDDFNCDPNNLGPDTNNGMMMRTYWTPPNSSPQHILAVCNYYANICSRQERRIRVPLAIDTLRDFWVDRYPDLHQCVFGGSDFL